MLATLPRQRIHPLMSSTQAARSIRNCTWGEMSVLGEGQRKGLLLGHLCDVLVAQRYPEVVILVQKHFLHPCLSDAARLVPREGTAPQNSSSPHSPQLTGVHMNDISSPETIWRVAVCIRSAVQALTWQGETRSSNQGQLT